MAYIDVSGPKLKKGTEAHFKWLMGHVVVFTTDDTIEHYPRMDWVTLGRKMLDNKTFREQVLEEDRTQLILNDLPYEEAFKFYKEFI